MGGPEIEESRFLSRPRNHPPLVYLSVYSWSKIPVVGVEVDFDDGSILVECAVEEGLNMTAVVWHREEVVELQCPTL